MNFYEYIQDNIKDKHLTDIEILRYIYLSFCQFFSFDARWNYTYLWDDDKLHYKLENKKVNLSNIDDFRTLCKPSTKYIVAPLVKEFTSLNTKVIDACGHFYLRVYNKDKTIDLDPIKADLTNMKINIRPKNFLLHGVGEKERLYFQEELDNSLDFSFKNIDDVILEQSKYTTKENLEHLVNLINTSSFKYYQDASDIMRMYARFNKVSYETYINKDYEFHKFIIDYPDNVLYEILKIDNYYKAVSIDSRRIDDVKYDKLYRSRSYKKNNHII